MNRKEHVFVLIVPSDREVMDRIQAFYGLGISQQFRNFLSQLLYEIDVAEVIPYPPPPEGEMPEFQEGERVHITYITEAQKERVEELTEQYGVSAHNLFFLAVRWGIDRFKERGLEIVKEYEPNGDKEDI